MISLSTNTSKLKASWLNILGILFIVAIATLIFWFQFYSINIANNEKTIAIRRKYSKILWQVKNNIWDNYEFYPHINSAYDIAVLSKKENEDAYIYTFSGYFQKINEQNQLSLTNNHNQTYIFDIEVYSSTSIKNIDTTKIININPESAKFVYEPIYTDSALSTFLQFNTPLTIIWTDNRTLKEINENYRKNKHINNISQQTYIIHHDTSQLK